jgi:PKD repeat protein
MSAVVFITAVGCDPDGLLESAVGVAGAAGAVRVAGWAYDPDAPNDAILVRIDIDHIPAATVSAGGPRPDVAKVQKIREGVGFSATIPATPGTRTVCAHALNAVGTDGSDTLIGCSFVTVPATAPVAHQLGLVRGTGTAPYTEGLKWVISDPQGERVNCRIDWDGGPWDDNITDCHSRIGAFHTYTSPGTYQVALQMTDTGGSVAYEYRTVVVTDTRSEPFDITVRNNGGFTESQAATLTEAADRWSRVISEGVGGVPVTIPAGDCDPSLPSFSGSIDDLLVDAIAVPIDGPGNVLAAAGPCYIRNSNDIPLYGVIIVDSADVNSLSSAGLLGATVMHEMGHVLGIGTLWRQPPLTGAGSSDPRFTGPMASVAMNAISTGWTSVPVENTGGPGTADAHWRESVLGDELMTGYIDTANPLSAVTVGSLADIGYRVDVRGADSFGTASSRLGPPDGGREIEERLVRPSRRVG